MFSLRWSVYILGRVPQDNLHMSGYSFYISVEVTFEGGMSLLSGPRNESNVNHHEEFCLSWKLMLEVCSSHAIQNL